MAIPSLGAGNWATSSSSFGASQEFGLMLRRILGSPAQEPDEDEHVNYPDKRHVIVDDVPIAAHRIVREPMGSREIGGVHPVETRCDIHEPGDPKCTRDPVLEKKRRGERQDGRRKI